MIDKRDVIDFFDRCAPTWDAELVRSDAVINAILDRAGVSEGVDVLDVACGTGVLFPDYLKRGVMSLTGIDISPEMAAIAREKFRNTDVEVICGDVEKYLFPRKFDVIVVYNAFPHFPNPENLIRVLAELLRPDGRLTIAHGMSRAAIDAHHHGSAHAVSNGLMHEDELAALMWKHLSVVVKISDSEKYVVSGRKMCDGEPRP